MRVDVETLTDVGRKRPHNEDSHGTWVPESARELDRRGALLVVADGMGGSLAGEVASRLAVQTVVRAWRDATGERPLDDLYAALDAANQRVHEESGRNPELHGMGTTCTAVVLRGRDLFVAHVGDSRAYLVRDGRIRQVTRDHSLVAQMVRDGQLTPEQAKTDPRRNVVTRSVGVGPHVEIDAERQEAALAPGDTVVLCSDGLHGLVADDELARFASDPDLARGCASAIGLANDRGGHDNITVLMARVTSVDSAAADEARRNAGDEADDDVPRDDDAPRDEAVGATAAGGGATAVRGANSAHLLVWLIAALIVLLVAVAAMLVVWQRIESEKSNLQGRDPGRTGEQATAWRP